MAVTVANSPLKKMTFNGLPVKKWIHDGVTVFNAEKMLYDNGMVVHWYPSESGWGGTAIDNTTSLGGSAVEGTTGDECRKFGGWYTDLINFDEWNTVTIHMKSAYSMSGSCDYVVAMLTNKISNSIFPYYPEAMGDVITSATHITEGDTGPYYFGSNYVAAVYGIGGVGQTATDEDWVIDVSGVTGEWYLAVYAVTRVQAARSANFEMTCAKLS